MPTDKKNEVRLKAANIGQDTFRYSLEKMRETFGDEMNIQDAYNVVLGVLICYSANAIMHTYDIAQDRSPHQLIDLLQTELKSSLISIKRSMH